MPVLIKYSESLGGHEATGLTLESAKRTLMERFRRGRSGRCIFALKRKEGNIAEYNVTIVDNEGCLLKKGQAHVQFESKLHKTLKRREEAHGQGEQC